MQFSKKLGLGGLALLLLAIIWLQVAISERAQAADFANPAFQKVWAQTDQAVKQQQASRTWFWGPEPGTSRQEAYAEAPGGLRQVQYFDKARMEINSPTTNAVTNGLLARELVSGQLQTGNNRFETRNPAQVTVGGDPDNPGPTYATFTAMASLNNDKRVAKRNGFITDTIDRSGKIGTTKVSANLANYAYYSEELGHNVPDVFYGTFLQWKANLNLDWVFALGLPITEPFWATFKVGGVDKELLVQLYERRALTFTPSNPPGYLVEMGNIGQHYAKWRYGNENPPVSTTPTDVSNPTVVRPTTPPPVTTPAGSTTAPATTPPAATTSPATTVPATTNPPGATTAPAKPALDTEEKQLLQLINTLRGEKGLGPLQVNDNLVNAAKWLSNDMASKNYFSHNDSQGRDLKQRLTAFGYTAFPQGENIGGGYSRAEEVFQGWKDSPGHNENMLGSAYRYIGISRAYNAAALYQWYWVIDLGG